MHKLAFSAVISQLIHKNNHCRPVLIVLKNEIDDSHTIDCKTFFRGDASAATALTADAGPCTLHGGPSIIHRLSITSVALRRLVAPRQGAQIASPAGLGVPQACCCA